MKRPVAEEILVISIYRLKGLTLNELGRVRIRGEIVWSRRGVETAKVGSWLEYENGCAISLELDYFMCQQEVRRQYKIDIEQMSCNYGGTRNWFRCWKCNSRAANLYMCGTYFLCRDCGRITYEKNNQSKRWRAYDWALGSSMDRKLQDKLDKTHRYYYAGKPTKAAQRLLISALRRNANLRKIDFDRVFGIK